MLTELEQSVLRALLAADPISQLEIERQRNGLNASGRAFLDKISADGFLMTSLLVKKLRFERLTRGEPALEEFFSSDPEAFVRLFQNYTGSMPPTAYFPQEESTLFQSWDQSPRPRNDQATEGR